MSPVLGPEPRTPQTQSRGNPPPGALVPPRQRAKPPRKSMRCGVGDGSPRPSPPHLRPVGSGPRPHAPRTGERAWESAKLWTPNIQTIGAPPGALVPPPQRAKPAHKSAHCRAADGSPRPQPPRPRKTGSGSRLPTTWTGGRRERERAKPWMPQARAMGAPSGGPRLAPTAHNAGPRERALWIW